MKTTVLLLTLLFTFNSYAQVEKTAFGIDYESENKDLYYDNFDENQNTSSSFFNFIDDTSFLIRNISEDKFLFITKEFDIKLFNESIFKSENTLRGLSIIHHNNQFLKRKSNVNKLPSENRIDSAFTIEYPATIFMSLDVDNQITLQFGDFLEEQILSINELYLNLADLMILKM